jgi:hypothetical protein
LSDVFVVFAVLFLPSDVFSNESVSLFLRINPAAWPGLPAGNPLSKKRAFFILMNKIRQKFRPKVNLPENILAFAVFVILSYFNMPMPSCCQGAGATKDKDL